MNKTLKKTLSIILTILMVVTTVPFAFAADTVTVYLKNTAGWNSTVYAYCWKDNGEVQPLGSWPGTAISAVEGEENLYTVDVPADIYGLIFNDGSNMTPDLFLPTDGSDCYDNGSGQWTTFTADSGEADEVPEIKLGETYTPDEEGYVKFVPAVSGTFIIRSVSNVDPRVTLYDADFAYLIDEDDSGYREENDLDFYLEYGYTAGETYYFEFYDYENVYNYTVILECKTHTGGTQLCGGYKCEICNRWYGEGTGAHTGGTQICGGYKCEVCEQWYGEGTNEHVSEDGDSFCDVCDVFSGNKIELGDTYTLEKEEYVKFVPTVSGTFIIRSVSDVDPKVTLYDADFAYLADEDDSGYREENNRDFYLEYEYTAGETYYFSFYDYDGVYNYTVILECTHSELNGDYCSFCQQKVYKITHQPTAEEPYVELNDDTDASYQWYKVEGGDVEITDENATVYSGYYGSTSYSEDAGWTGVYSGGEDNNERRFFIIDLKKGDKVRVEFSGALTKEVYLFAGNSNTYFVDVEEGKTVYELTAEGDDNYQLIAWLADEEVTVKAYVTQSVYTPVDGQTAATLTPTVLGDHVCEVTFADGTTEMSDIFEVTKLHDCDFSGEWEYDSSKHWKECVVDGCDKISEEATHSYTNGKCACGYECPHESYTKGKCDVCEYPCFHSFTEFTETVAPKCEETGWEESYCDYGCGIKLEQEIPALEHDWVSGGVERPVQNIDLSWSDGYYYDTCKNDATHINKTGVAKRADYTAFDEAYKALKTEQKNEALTDAGAASVNQAVMTGMTMPQNIIEGESTTAYLNNWVTNAQSILAKIESGEYVKADYTEIDEAIKAVDEALENATISEEMKAELEDIKADLAALKENASSTMADVNALLDRAEAITETMADCANGVHSFTKYEEIEAPECEKAGKESAECDNGCGAINEKETEALEHIDNDGDYECDNGCGHEFEKPATPDEPADDVCEDCGKVHNGFFSEIICFFTRIINFIKKLFA